MTTKKALKVTFPQAWEATVTMSATKFGPWAFLTVPKSYLARALSFGLIGHELGAVALPGIVLVDARASWFFETTTRQVQVVQGARVISGATSLADLEMLEAIHCLALIDEVDLPRPAVRETWKFCTSATRLVISTRWQEFTIIGEPFVQRTQRGHAPAILIKTANGEIHYVLAGAKSLADALELIRGQSGTINGARVRTRKLGVDQTAPYELQRLIDNA